MSCLLSALQPANRGGVGACHEVSTSPLTTANEFFDEEAEKNGIRWWLIPKDAMVFCECVCWEGKQKHKEQNQTKKPLAFLYAILHYFLSTSYSVFNYYIFVTLGIFQLLKGECKKMENEGQPDTTF